ncbi:MAG: recombinase family protein [Actinomycetota bacterium]|nr:recombinase family protein [Actinomycetota bacterium]
MGGLPVAGYYRVSLARDNMHAPELYEDEIGRYCSYKKLELARIYSDLDYSAFRGAKARPSLEELVEHRNDYASVIVPKLSRFGRSMKELIRLFELFDADRIPLVFLDMNLDTSTSQGRLLRHILAAFAEYESDVKADYTRANHRRVRAEGRPWGTAPYGFRRGPEPATWEVDPERGAVVAEIFDRYAAGSSANAIARWLNEEQIPSSKNVRWKGQAIGKMLDNPAYAALSLLDHNLVEAQWAPIVTRATWDAVRARRAADVRRSSNLGKTKPHKPYLLSGLMWCGQCGRKMTHTTTTRDGKGVYHCNGNEWGTWSGCLNARVYGPLVEARVAEMFLARCSFTIVTEMGERAGSPRQLWEQATLADRKRLLNLVIANVVATPVDHEVPRHERRTRLTHDLHIEWKNELDEGEQIVVVGDEAEPPAPARSVSHGRFQMFRAHEARTLEEMATAEAWPSPVGKSWAEWQRELLQAR